MSGLRSWGAWAVVGLALALLPTSGSTQSLPGLSIGLHGVYNFNDLDEAAGVHAVIDLSTRLAVCPAYQSYFVEFGRLRRFSTTLRWLPSATSFRWYVGIGPYWSWGSGVGTHDTDLGVVGLLGAEMRGRILRPFAEMQVLKDGAVSTELAAGVRFVIARWR